VLGDSRLPADIRAPKRREAGAAAPRDDWDCSTASSCRRGRSAASRCDDRSRIGPAVRVGEDIADSYRARFGEEALRGRNLDLWTVAERVLRAAGVESVERLDLCTACDPVRFFSHRRDGPVTGRQGVIGYVA
jgi:hypothetical protein